MSLNMIPRKPNCSPNIYVLVFILYRVVVAVSAAPTLTNETDYEALLAFKGQVVSDPSDALSSWNESVHFCDWNGVTCGQKHPRVTALRLPSLGLAGSLSPQIWNLTFLRFLDLDDNDMKGILPLEIGQLRRLQVLTLANNSIEGELPRNLTSCLDLRVLRLTGNNLRGLIPDELGSLTKLTNLELPNNRFTGEIPSVLGNLSALTKLSLEGNLIQGSIPPQLGHLSNLEFLMLGGNNLSGNIPASLYNISSIRIFAVEQNNLDGSLPSHLFLAFPKLEGLYLGVNKFSGLVPGTIANASQAIQIDFSMNAFVGPIPKDLGGLKNLQVLNFELNDLGTEEGDDLSFLTSLTNCTGLQALSAGDNRLTGILPDSVGNLSSTLTKLLLDGNLISGTIPSGIDNLVNLQLLTLGENMFTGRIPSSMAKLSKLQILHLGQNNLSGSIPSSLGNLTSLSLLYFPQNMLEGTIPASLGDCKRLNILVLDENRLAGVVPQELFGLSSLSNLSFSGNYLTGQIPSQVGKLVNLQTLNLSLNNMSGEIPSTLGDGLVLEYIYFEGNQFSGSVPPSMSSLRGLKVLDLSRNNFSGKIPGFLADLPFIENLNLSFNKFEGEVPNKGIFLRPNAVSVVGNNGLCGGPPSMQLPKCKVGATKSRTPSRRTVLAITVPIFIFCLLVGIIATVLYRWRRPKSVTASIESVPSTKGYHPRLSYGELSRATNEFSSENMIGEGSFGAVYKGILPSNGQCVAVKVLKLEERGASKSFMAECEALRNIRHRNLVKMMTSCSTVDSRGDEFKALVFEFMPNGNLDKWLHPSLKEVGGNDSSSGLSLTQRLNIAIDVAAALDYLHHQCDIPIVHSDLKPSNVLLDSDFSAKVSDFGLAKFLAGKESAAQSSSIAIRGTVGYVAPEYGVAGFVSTRGDTYSFGILLLELFTGKRPTDPMFDGELGLRGYVERYLPDGLDQVLDPSLLLGEVQGNLQQCLLLILRVGLMCSAAQPNERMDIGEAATKLRKTRDDLKVVEGETDYDISLEYIK